MRKLLKLKRWLTLPEAARHLTILYDEEVSEADLLGFALDGHLTLSVHLVNGAIGRCGPIVPIKDVRSRTVPSLDGASTLVLYDGLRVSEGEVLVYDEEVLGLEGVWDLSMLGAERLDVERRLQELTGSPAQDLVNLNGPIVSHSGKFCQLVARSGRTPPSYSWERGDSPAEPKEPEYCYPADGLPSDSVLVVRISALEALEARIAEVNKPAEKPLGTRERTTLLVIIAALADAAKLDIKRPSKTAAAIEAATTRIGARVSVRAIEEHLKHIPAALEDRGGA